MRKGHGKRLTFYDIGATPFFALQKEPRVSYCLYVPEDYDEAGEDRFDLIVLVHGTERGAATYRDHFREFAEQHRAIVLAPLFPANLFGANDLDNYKLLDCQGVRFDHLLLDMVAEVSARYRFADKRFLLHGFSGGGHFAHRFFYLHAHRLKGVSIGAPGVVTLLDEGRDWWTGTRNLEAVFGRRSGVDAMRSVAVQTVVGSDDRETWEITIPKNSPWWMTGANDAGKDRIERISSLADSLERAGIAVRRDIVPNVAHDGWAVLYAVQDFFAQVLDTGDGVTRARDGQRSGVTADSSHD